MRRGLTAGTRDILRRVTRDRLLLAVLVAVALGALAGVGLIFRDATRPQPLPVVVAQDREARVQPRPVERRRATRPRPAKAKTKVRSKARREVDPELPAEDRIQARAEYRQERLADVDQRLDAYAADAGWDEATTEQVRAAILENADDISARLEAVAAGEVEWEQVREDLRQDRIDRAARVRRLLGDAEFDRFVREMDFARFLGEEPVRGRIMRR
jgi:hypothetical protein